MATVQSTLGMLTGKIGNLRTSNWNGINVVAQQPAGYSDANTQVQQDNRAMFKGLAQAGRQAIAAIRQGLSQFTAGTTPWAQFMKLGKDAFTLVAGVVTLTAPQTLIFALGDLPGIVGGTVTHGVGTNVVIDWTNNSAAFGALGTDRLNLVLVAKDGSEALVLSDVAPRSAHTYAVALPAAYTQGDYAMYAYFSEAGKPLHTSDSTAIEF